MIFIPGTRGSGKEGGCGSSDQEPHPAGLCNQGKLFRSDLKCTSNICVSSVSVSRAMVCVNDLKGHPPTL